VVVRVLIAIAVALGAGCYNPTIASCQFKCGSGNACPSTTTCIDGECMTSEGVCPGATCTASPPAMCGPSPAPVIDAIDCACSSGQTMAESTAVAFCSNASGWRLAVLDSPIKLANAPADSAGDLLWVGAMRTGMTFAWLGTNEPVDPNAWQTQPDPRGLLNCVAIDPQHKLHNVDCGVPATGMGFHHALCDHP
jgi:hypothetical protein